MSDRLRCINPACRRTAPKSNFPWSSEIVCSKCWRSVPSWMKNVYRRLRRLRKQYEKQELMGVSVNSQWWGDLAVEQARNWSHIRDFFEIKPEFPAGLDGFLKEVFDGR